MHKTNAKNKTNLNTNFGYQFGELGNSRLDFAGGANPSPSYYQKLPSYFLADNNGPDYAGAYVAEQEFINNGQLDWNRMYDANITNNNSRYFLSNEYLEEVNFKSNIQMSKSNKNILALLKQIVSGAEQEVEVTLGSVKSGELDIQFDGETLEVGTAVFLIESDPVQAMTIVDAPVLTVPPVANVERYDQLYTQEVNHV